MRQKLQNSKGYAESPDKGCRFLFIECMLINENRAFSFKTKRYYAQKLVMITYHFKVNLIGQLVVVHSFCCLKN